MARCSPASLVGFGFLTKMLQAFLVLPVFALVYLLAAPTPVRRRIVQLLAALAATIVSAGWWVAVVELCPHRRGPTSVARRRNSVLDLVLGYNGLGRLTGNETGQRHRRRWRRSGRQHVGRHRMGARCSTARSGARSPG